MRSASCLFVIGVASLLAGNGWAAQLEVIGEELYPPTVAVQPCRAECVDYVYHRHGSKCKFDRCDMKEMVVMVKDPCSNCCLEVPVCVPCCCSTICQIDSDRGLFGRCIYEYCWDCGFRMEIVATKHGDFIVHYYGVK